MEENKGPDEDSQARDKSKKGLDEDDPDSQMERILRQRSQQYRVEIRRSQLNDMLTKKRIKMINNEPAGI